jgi:drug/metabolite transporter (DMT)-like permease
MPSVLLGALAAGAASSLYNGGLALQALEARGAPSIESLRLSLLRRLVTRPRWLLGTGLTVLGWPLQTVALALAPLAVVQPGLAFGLLLLLVLGHWTLGEPVGRREALAVVGVVGGVAGLTLVAPAASDRHAPGAVLAIVLAGLALPAVAPYAAGRRARMRGTAAALSAGLALAWSGLSTKFVADALTAQHWFAAAAWAVATGLASGLGLLSEMTALQHRPATQVAPFVFVVQVVVPVVAAPPLTGEDWAHAPLGPSGVITGLVLVTCSAVLLITSPAVRSVVAEVKLSSESDSGGSLSAARRDANAATPNAEGAAGPGAVTTTRSPGDSDGIA